MRCEICGEGTITDGLPDWLCWGSIASPERVHDWVRRFERNNFHPYDETRRFLGSIGSTEAADALRSYLTVDDPRILEPIVSSLGWSGDATDGPALIELITHPDPRVRLRVMESLAELEITAAAEPLAARLGDPEVDGKERLRLLGCLAWLRYPGVLPELRELLRLEGVSAVAHRLVLVGDADDRAEMARIAIESLERSAAEGYVVPWFTRNKQWQAYTRAVGAVAPEEVALAEAGLSEAARLALTPYPITLSGTDDKGAEWGPLTIPRRTIAGYTDVAPETDDEPPAKFFGQPDWRESPTWPVGGDGRLLMFYGQLPLGDGRTAYLFTAGPDEFTALGPGSAMVIQPGGECHLPTVERFEGPRSYDWVVDQTRFVQRMRRLPQRERYVVWSEGMDPVAFREITSAPAENWNKVAGTPLWLQGADTPGPEWTYALQFTADAAGSERGDGAIFYGWVNSSGQGALGWQCS